MRYSEILLPGKNFFRGEKKGADPKNWKDNNYARKETKYVPLCIMAI